MLLDQPAEMVAVALDDDGAFYGPFYVLAADYDALRAEVGRLQAAVDALAGRLK